MIQQGKPITRLTMLVLPMPGAPLTSSLNDQFGFSRRAVALLSMRSATMPACPTFDHSV